MLRERGPWVVIGLLGASRAEIDLALLMRKRLTVTGSVLRSRPLEEKGALVQEFGRRMLPLLADSFFTNVMASLYFARVCSRLMM